MSFFMSQKYNSINRYQWRQRNSFYVSDACSSSSKKHSDSLCNSSVVNGGSGTLSHTLSSSDIVTASNSRNDRNLLFCVETQQNCDLKSVSPFIDTPIATNALTIDSIPSELSLLSKASQKSQSNTIGDIGNIKTLNPVTRNNRAITSLSKNRKMGKEHEYQSNSIEENVSNEIHGSDEDFEMVDNSEGDVSGDNINENGISIDQDNNTIQSDSNNNEEEGDNDSMDVVSTSSLLPTCSKESRFISVTHAELEELANKHNYRQHTQADKMGS